jgi:zinc transport system substrate-binding protein
MPHTSASPIFFLTLSAGIALSAPAFADTKEASHDHDHSHAHDHAHDQDDIYKGYFDDAQIKDRPLSDWAGEWQSVYPLLQQGALDEVMQHKAEGSDKTAAEYKTYYDVGYATDVNRITIEGNAVTFFRDGDPVQGRYASDGYEVLTYEKGNRGVRYVFAKEGGDAEAPRFIQFSDHIIAPQKADHYHLYWGDDRAEVLKELTNWPTYFPAEMSASEIAADMQAH